MLKVILICLFISFLALPLFAQDPDDVYWDSTMANIGGGLDGAVRALAVYKGKLIVAGDFTTAGGVVVNHIAAWNDTAWSALGSGIHGGSVNQLATWNDRLVVAGVFDSTGGTATRNIAAWNGNSWEPLGAGLDGPVTGLCEYNGKLIVGYSGFFGGEGKCGSMLSWDGSTWVLLHSYPCGGEGLPFLYSVTGFEKYNAMLMEGVLYMYADDGFGWVNAWDGSDWSHPIYQTGCGGGPMKNFYSKLIITTATCSMGPGCWFDLIAWDGDSCSAFADIEGSIPQMVNALECYDMGLVTAGHFSSVQNIAVKNIAMTYNGSTWLPLGTGIDGGGIYAQVYALAAYDNKLIVGGDFATAGGKSSPYIAQWIKHRPHGDADGDGKITVSDVVYLINYLFKGGLAPLPLSNADANCDGKVNAVDAVRLIYYLFKGGPSPAC